MAMIRQWTFRQGVTHPPSLTLAEQWVVALTVIMAKWSPFSKVAMVGGR